MRIEEVMPVCEFLGVFTLRDVKLLFQTRTFDRSPNQMHIGEKILSLKKFGFIVQIGEVWREDLGRNVALYRWEGA